MIKLPRYCNQLYLVLVAVTEDEQPEKQYRQSSPLKSRRVSDGETLRAAHLRVRSPSASGAEWIIADHARCVGTYRDVRLEDELVGSDCRGLGEKTIPMTTF